jgi:hypothetical protein
MSSAAIGLILPATVAAAVVTFPRAAAAQRQHPGVRNAHAAVYDSRACTLLLFGGATASEVRADLWRWRGSWRQTPAAGPAPRAFPAMVYDSVSGEVVLFGGSRVLFGDSASPPAMLADTWVLRNERWIRVPGGGPGPRAEAAAAYDLRRGRTVLFGGRAIAPDGSITRLGDTWKWDGRRWTRVSTAGPAPRSGAAMAWHPELRAVVLFGGSGGPMGDTWSWNGREWTGSRSRRCPVASTR